MAGAVVEIWLTISALLSLAILSLAISHSDMRLKRRLWPKAACPHRLPARRQPLPR